MPDDERMTIDEKYKYLRAMQKRYRVASRKEKGRLLEEMRLVTGYHDKSLSRLMRSSLIRKPRTRQRGRTYGPEMDDALRVISRSNNHICAERQAPGLVERALHLASHGELRLSPSLLKKLDAVSVSTVRRILKRIRRDEPCLPRAKPRPARGLVRSIVMKRIPWDERVPGHFEVDLVHHGGADPRGDYIHTLQIVDVATGWSERAAILGRSFLVVQDAFQHIKGRLPFKVLELHPDNGSEFLNHHMLRFFGHSFPGLQLSRTRPYHKNDNRFVEQKNSTLVRAYLGYGRLDTVAQVCAINQLYEKLWLYDNFFQPVLRLKEKVISSQPSHTTRLYDRAKTPFQRLCETGAIPEGDQARLQALYLATNPLALLDEIFDLLDQISRLPCAAKGQTQDVYGTLMATTTSERSRALR